MKRLERVKAPEFRIYYTSFSTPIGRIYLAATQKGLWRAAWECGSEKEFIKEVRSQKTEVRSIVKNTARFTAIKNDMLKYFSGEPVSFKKYVIFLDGTDFQKKTWKVLSDIPYGKVLTYKQVAEKIGKPKAYRAVGGACGANELPIIIPCHRVMASSGGLGGFSGGLGLKRQLLKLEGVKIK